MNIITCEMETIYQSPATYVIDITPEGVLCASGDEGTEELGENFGNW